MAEYYAVLSKAVASLETNSADARRAVYDKARNALIGQLKAIDPPLPTSEISRQRLELEEAIRRVERETSAIPAGSPVRVAPAKRTPPSERPPASERPAPASPKDVFRRAIQEAEAQAAGEALNPPPSVPARRERTPAPVVARADDWSSDHVDAPTPPPPAKQQQYLPSQGYVEDKPAPNDGPRLAPDYDYEWEQGSPPPSSSSQLPPPRSDEVYAETRDGGDRSGRVKGEKRGKPARRSDLDAVMDQPARPSRAPVIILLVLIAVMVVGIGAFAFSQRAMIADLMHGFEANKQANVTPTAAPATPPADTSGKATDRLLPPGATDNGSTDNGAGSADNGAATSTDNGTTADNTVRDVTPDASGATPPAAAPTTAQAPAATTDTTGGAAATAAGDDDALVAQPAMLYEQPLDPNAQASGMVQIKAAVTWSYVPDNDGGQIVANIDVPDRGMKLALSIAKNTDSTLPVSHVIQMKFTLPANFPGKSISDVPRLMSKTTEDARGSPLIGAPAKGTQGFVIVLSNEPSDLSANLALLHQDWFDLYLVYGNGQRALITFEKGTPGERVFEKAFGAWESNG